MSGSWISGNLVMPGVRLGVTMFVRLQGHNTYTQHGYIYSSLVGELKLVTNADKARWMASRETASSSANRSSSLSNCLSQSEVSANWNYYLEKLLLWVSFHCRIAECRIIMCVDEVVTLGPSLWRSTRRRTWVRRRRGPWVPSCTGVQLVVEMRKAEVRGQRISLPPVNSS